MTHIRSSATSKAVNTDALAAAHTSGTQRRGISRDYDSPVIFFLLYTVKNGDFFLVRRQKLWDNEFEGSLVHARGARILSDGTKRRTRRGEMDEVLVVSRPRKRVHHHHHHLLTV